VKLFKIRITSGTEKGRYVGVHFGGYQSTPDMLINPPINVPGYGLWLQERAATRFLEPNTSYVQAELRALGYETELVPVELNDDTMI
jgi:hypothetical protein